MLVVVSDTHGTEDHRLRGRTREAAEGADLVVHAGDFHRVPVLDAFEATTARLRAVFGNNASAAVRDRLPEIRTVEYADVTFVVTHRHRSGDTGLVMLARARDADVAICGHSHRPRFDDSTAVPILNPGSYAQPRGNRPAHAELTAADGGGLNGRLVTPDGDVVERLRIGTN